MKIDNILYFSASWCGPCKTYKPVFKRVMEDMGLPYQEVDVDENPELAQANHVMSVPTVVILGHENGELPYSSRILDSIIGAFPEPALRERLQKIG